jgi:predicted deacylase
VYPERVQYCHHGWQHHDEVTQARINPDGTMGKPDGRQVERSAHIVYNAALKYADLWMNFHADPQLGEIAYPFTQYNPTSPHIKDEETKQKVEKMIEAWGITTIDQMGVFGPPDKEPRPPERVNELLLSKGVAALGFELHDCRRFDWYDNVDVAVRGIMNVMKPFDMIDGEIEKQTGKNLVILPRLERAGVYNANRAGFVEFEVDNFIKVKKGDSICKIYDIWGDLVEDCKMPVDGYVIGWICGFHGDYQVVTTGDYICYLAKEKEM